MIGHRIHRMPDTLHDKIIIYNFNMLINPQPIKDFAPGAEYDTMKRMRG